MDDYGDFYDYHQDDSDTAEMWEENQVFLDHEGWEEEEEEEDFEEDDIEDAHLESAYEDRFYMD